MTWLNCIPGFWDGQPTGSVFFYDLNLYEQLGNYPQKILNLFNQKKTRRNCLSNSTRDILLLLMNSMHIPIFSSVVSAHETEVPFSSFFTYVFFSQNNPTRELLFVDYLHAVMGYGYVEIVVVWGCCLWIEDRSCWFLHNMVSLLPFFVWWLLQSAFSFLV